MKTKSAVILRAVVFLLIALPLAAQTAALVGTVKDQQGAAMPKVTVTLTGEQTGVTQTTTTDTAGDYEFSTVRPGTYKLQIVQKDFQTFVQSGIALEVDARIRVDAVMQVGETSTIVNVEVQAATVQTESSAMGSVVDTKKIVELPLNGRFFLDLALMQPGTVVP